MHWISPLLPLPQVVCDGHLDHLDDDGDDQHDLYDHNYDNNDDPNHHNQQRRSPYEEQEPVIPCWHVQGHGLDRR